MRLKIKIKAVLALIGGMLVHLTIGTLYCWGNINPYVTSYIRKHSKPDTLQYDDTVWVFALAVTGQGLAMFLGGILEKRIGSRLTTLCGGLTTSIGVMLSYFTVQYSYYLFLVTYGFLFGLGVGIAYAPPLAVAMKWFPKYKGVANGFIVAGFGGGAFIFDQIQTNYLNFYNLPALNATQLNTTQDIGSNKYFDQESILSKVPSMFLLLGGCYTAMQIIGVLLMFPAPDDSSNSERCSLVGKQADTDTEDQMSGFQNIIPPTADISIHPRDMIKTRRFITLWVMFLLNAQVVIFISTLYKTYGESEVYNDDTFLTNLGAVAAIFNAVGRIIWGLFADKVSFKTAMATLCGLMTCLMSSLYTTHLIPLSAGKPLFFIWICAIFFTFSGSFSLFPTAIAKTFGPKYVSVNYGILFTSSAVAGPVGALLSTVLLRALHSWGLFIMSGCMSLVAYILALSFSAKGADGRQV